MNELGMFGAFKPCAPLGQFAAAAGGLPSACLAGRGPAAAAAAAARAAADKAAAAAGAAASAGGSCSLTASDIPMVGLSSLHVWPGPCFEQD
jgi:hypothetical protein